ncbi:MAG: hypothetical protein R8K21_04525 [Mariprofundales bacterium]
MFMISQVKPLQVKQINIKIFVIFILLISTHSFAFADDAEKITQELLHYLPAAAWHRGDVRKWQEDSDLALLSSLQSASPNIEVDLIDFINEKGEHVGLVAHDYDMLRASGSKDKYIDQHNVQKLPARQVDKNLPASGYWTVLDLFAAIDASKAKGIIPLVSLDLKEEGDSGEDFGRWIGTLIREHNMQNHVFASSFYKTNVVGVEDSCPECLTGGLVFDDHFALQFLANEYTSLDISTIGRILFFFGFPCKDEYKHDFVLIQDDIFLQHPELSNYWKTQRGVKFVGVYTYGKAQKAYTDAEWAILQQADWLELDPIQMQQYLHLPK